MNWHVTKRLCFYTCKLHFDVKTKLKKRKLIFRNMPGTFPRCFLQQETLPSMSSTGWFPGTNLSVSSESNYTIWRALW